MYITTSACLYERCKCMKGELQMGWWAKGKYKTYNHCYHHYSSTVTSDEIDNINKQHQNKDPWSEYLCERHESMKGELQTSWWGKEEQKNHTARLL